MICSPLPLRSVGLSFLESRSTPSVRRSVLQPVSRLDRKGLSGGEMVAARHAREIDDQWPLPDQLVGSEHRDCGVDRTGQKNKYLGRKISGFKFLVHCPGKGAQGEAFVLLHLVSNGGQAPVDARIRFSDDVARWLLCFGLTQGTNVSYPTACRSKTSHGVSQIGSRGWFRSHRLSVKQSDIDSALTNEKKGKKCKRSVRVVFGHTDLEFAHQISMSLTSPGMQSSHYHRSRCPFCIPNFGARMSLSVSAHVGCREFLISPTNSGK